MRWEMKLKFSNSGEETEKPIYVCAEDSIEHGKDTVNFLIRDKLTKREATVDVDLKSLKPYTLENSGQFAPVVTFECRNVEPTSFYPGVRMNFLSFFSSFFCLLWSNFKVSLLWCL